MKQLFIFLVVGMALYFLFDKGDEANKNDKGEDMQPLTTLDKIKVGAAVLLDLKSNLEPSTMSAPVDDPTKYVGYVPGSEKMVSYGLQTSPFSSVLKKTRGMFQHDERPNIQEVYYRTGRLIQPEYFKIKDAN